MAETIGLITNIKVASFLPGSPNSFDVGAITIKDAAGASWFLYIWNTRDDAPAVQRVLSAQRLALVRDAAFRTLTVHAFHDDDSSNVTEITVDVPVP